jgi:predicted transcriptional regulator
MSKHRVIVEAVVSGKSQSEVARLYGISQPRVSQLVAAWRPLSDVGHHSGAAVQDSNYELDAAAQTKKGMTTSQTKNTMSK